MIDIGFGLGIDEATGEMVVVHADVVDAELARSDDPCDRAVAALVTGRPGGAARELDAAPRGFRRDVLRGELARITGRPHDSVTAFVDVLRDYAPQGLRRAMVLQHLGKAEHAAGRQRDATTHLGEALKLRLNGHAPEDQVASSRAMLEVARRAEASVAWSKRVRSP